jgi:hypothetical protein
VIIGSDHRDFPLASQVEISKIQNPEWQEPETRWEDGDLHCGVRGVADFRPNLAKV